MIRKVVIASDSFKGSLSSLEVAEAAAAGVRKALPGCETVGVCIGDGGEGTAEAMAAAGGWKRRSVIVHDPSGRKTEASYFISDDGKAVMEMASASGLTLLRPEERDPLTTSTFGTGEMILDAVMNGCRNITIGIGGSATNDGGTGMMEALGFGFISSDGSRITGLCGARLADIAGIDSSRVYPEISETDFTVACDVDSPFCGKEGATYVFAAQKGADAAALGILESGMQSLCRIIRETTGKDLSRTAGAGAAGGLGGALCAFLKARLTKGTDAVLDMIGFDGIISGADLIVTGEGKIDGQTGRGKVISRVVKRAARYKIPVVAIAGIIDIEEDEIRRSGLAAAYPIGPRPKDKSDLEYAMRPEVASYRISDTVAKALASLSPSAYREIL